MQPVSSDAFKQVLEDTRQFIATTKNPERKLTSHEDTTAISDIMHSMFLQAIQNNHMQLFFKDFLHSYQSWLIYSYVKGSAEYSLLPALKECACKYSDRFNNSRREVIEKSVLDFVAERFPLPAQSTIHYLSLGSGNLLQDFIIVGRLVLAGYQTLHVNLIDPGYAGDFSKSTCDQFNLLSNLAKEMNVNLSMSFHTSVDRYQQKALPPLDLVVAIDFENFFNTGFDDVLKIHKLMEKQQQSRLFSSVGNHDYIFSSTKALMLSKKVAAEEVKLVAAHEYPETLKMIYLNYDEGQVKPDEEMFCTIILPFIRQLENVKHLELSLVAKDSKVKHQILKQNMEYYLNTVIPKGMTLKINWINPSYVLSNLVKNCDNRQNLVFYTAIRNPETFCKDVITLHEYFNEANFLFKMFTFLESNKVSPFTWSWDADNQQTQFLHDHPQFLVELYKQNIEPLSEKSQFLSFTK